MFRSAFQGAAALALLASCAAPTSTPPAPAGSTQASSAGSAITTGTGLVYQSLVEGSGTSPAFSDKVRVHYRGTLTNGTEFDSSYKRVQPAEFALNRVIKCWTEGVGMMKPGGKARLTCPPGIAYGERNVGDGLIPPNSTLIFEVELISIVR